MISHSFLVTLTGVISERSATNNNVHLGFRLISSLISPSAFNNRNNKISSFLKLRKTSQVKAQYLIAFVIPCVYTCGVSNQI